MTHSELKLSAKARINLALICSSKEELDLVAKELISFIENRVIEIKNPSLSY